MSTDFERMERSLMALVYRVQKLEERPLPALPDCCEAQAVALQMGYTPETICQISVVDPQARHEIIRELRKRGWAYSKIARALHLSERTIERAITG